MTTCLGVVIHMLIEEGELDLGKGDSYMRNMRHILRMKAGVKLADAILKNSITYQ